MKSAVQMKKETTKDYRIVAALARYHVPTMNRKRSKMIRDDMPHKCK